ncbi:hypothetical protein K505DRAFT_421043 [Melanomma pulvis-pyrius CBS 109.77]|uniref:Uncharacterized protein n=1 Tax=Melanomma pulvis-pyrius CBS 109.77 TaxID=1314802 RepID=A0A6A6WXA0_9PLEO|nr:hypothetical protein K505DRAFT_421043 [Melanomma pulvis-pyrius CBS 109.77]
MTGSPVSPTSGDASKGAVSMAVTGEKASGVAAGDSLGFNPPPALLRVVDLRGGLLLEVQADRVLSPQLLDTLCDLIVQALDLLLRAANNVELAVVLGDFCIRLLHLALELLRMCLPVGDVLGRHLHRLAVTVAVDIPLSESLPESFIFLLEGGNLHHDLFQQLAVLALEVGDLALQSHPLIVVLGSLLCGYPGLVLEALILEGLDLLLKLVALKHQFVALSIDLVALLFQLLDLYILRGELLLKLLASSPPILVQDLELYFQTGDLLLEVSHAYVGVDGLLGDLTIVTLFEFGGRAGAERKDWSGLLGAGWGGSFGLRALRNRNFSVQVLSFGYSKSKFLFVEEVFH